MHGEGRGRREREGARKRERKRERERLRERGKCWEWFTPLGGGGGSTASRPRAGLTWGMTRNDFFFLNKDTLLENRHL